MEIKGFITNLGKYNEGKLIGKWISFPISKEELNKVISEIGCDREGYEEYFFTDWDTEADFDFGEYPRVSDVNAVAEKIQNIHDDNLVIAIVEKDGVEGLDEYQKYNLFSDITDEAGVGYWAVSEFGDVPKWIEGYIDMYRLGSDYIDDCDCEFTSKGWLIKNE